MSDDILRIHFSDERLQQIYDKTKGYCFHCDKKLAWKNYGNLKGKAGWEVDHSIPISKGGTNHLNNLIPSCIPCNRDKGTKKTSQYRKRIDHDSSGEENIWVSLLGAAIVIGGIIVLDRFFSNKNDRDKI